MLPVLDNLNRALDSASNFSDEKLQDFQQFFEGIMLVGRQLNEVLEEMGVQPIAAVGESFDPHYHEAVATETTDEVPPYTITEELLRGYRIDDKVIRASMVKVSSPTKLTEADVS
jgi:molecular chaperone GrpE